MHLLEPMKACYRDSLDEYENWYELCILQEVYQYIIIHICANKEKDELYNIGMNYVYCKKHTKRNKRKKARIP